MKGIKIALISLGILAAAFVVIGMILPSKWEVSRSVVINAPSSTVYSFVANMKTGWPQWSAFDQEDPTIPYTYSGPEEGAGAYRSWVSKKMGDGNQKITKADPSTGIEYVLEIPEHKMVLDGVIAFEVSGNVTKVTWKDSADSGHNIMGKYCGVIVSKMIGKSFDKSLNSLKVIAEKKATEAKCPENGNGPCCDEADKD